MRVKCITLTNEKRLISILSPYCQKSKASSCWERTTKLSSQFNRQPALGESPDTLGVGLTITTSFTNA